MEPDRLKTRLENYTDCLEEARRMTAKQIRKALQDRNAMHAWAVEAYEKVLNEKRQKIHVVRPREIDNKSRAAGEHDE